MSSSTISETSVRPLQGGKESRRIQRISLTLPTRVEGKIDQKTSWDEITRLVDISAFGAGFTLKRPVKRGRLLLMTLPMPRQLRCYDHIEPQYRIWALVRRCMQITAAPDNELYSIGVAFVGKNPPAGYIENPSKLFDISHREEEGLWHLKDVEPNPDDSRLPKDLRRHSRFAIPETVLVEMLDENGDVVANEVTVTENISLGGAAVFSSFNVEPGSFLRVTSERNNVAIIAVVRGKRTGSDGIMRLHLEFIDHYFPLEGIES